MMENVLSLFVCYSEKAPVKHFWRLTQPSLWANFSKAEQNNVNSKRQRQQTRAEHWTPPNRDNANIKATM